jgi:hypothetical protein
VKSSKVGLLSLVLSSLLMVGAVVTPPAFASEQVTQPKMKIIHKESMKINSSKIDKVIADAKAIAKEERVKGKAKGVIEDKHIVDVTIIDGDTQFFYASSPGEEEQLIILDTQKGVCQ